MTNESGEAGSAKALRLLREHPDLDELRFAAPILARRLCKAGSDGTPKLARGRVKKAQHALLEALGAADESHELHAEAGRIIRRTFVEAEAATIKAWHKSVAEHARKLRRDELIELEQDRRAARREADRLERGERPAIADMLLDVAALDDMPDPAPLVDGVLFQGSLAFLVGDSGVGKSSFAISMALAVASSRKWLGHDVAAGRVLYVAGEGGAGLPKRVRAERAAWGGDTPAIDFLVAQLDLGDEATADELAALNAEHDFALIIYDTLNRHSGDAEENSATAMGRVVRGIDRIANAGNATTSLVLHHNNREGTIRGSSALYASADTVLDLSGEATMLTLKASKQKDAEGGFVGHYKLSQAHGSVIVEGAIASLESPGVAAESLGIALEHFTRTFSETGASGVQFRDVLMELMEVKRAQAYNVINALVIAHKLTKIGGRGSAFRLELAKEPTTIPIENKEKKK